jgi:hypothetical protein
LGQDSKSGQSSRGGGGARQCPVGTLCECLRLSRVRPDIVQLGWTMSGWEFLFGIALEKI